MTTSSPSQADTSLLSVFKKILYGSGDWSLSSFTTLRADAAFLVCVFLPIYAGFPGVVVAASLGEPVVTTR